MRVLHMEYSHIFAIYMNANTISTRECLSYGNLVNGVGHGGLSSFTGNLALVDMIGSLATYLYV